MGIVCVVGEGKGTREYWLLVQCKKTTVITKSNIDSIWIPTIEQFQRNWKSAKLLNYPWYVKVISLKQTDLGRDTISLYFDIFLQNKKASLVAQRVKHLPATQVDLGSIPGSGRSSGEGNGNPLQYLCPEKTQLQYLCPENPLDRGAPVGYSPWGCTESDMTEANSSICAN